MGKRFIGAAVLLLVAGLVALPAAAEEISGEYRVEGSNPGGAGSYSGTVTVQPAGGAWSVRWQIGNQVFVGTGTLRKSTLSVVYDGGFAVYQMTADGARGLWTPGDVTQLGPEAQQGREDWFR